MLSPNLAIPHIAAGQNQKEVTINDAINRIDARLTANRSKIWQSGDALTWTLTTEEFQTHARFFAGGTPDADITLNVPAVRAPFLCRNATLVNMLVQTGSATETVTLFAGDHALIYATGQDTLYAVGSTGDVGASLANLADVTVPNPENGDFLRFDGSSWSVLSAGIYQRTMLPFKGALLRRNTNYVIPSSDVYTPIPWEAKSYDSDDFWSAANDTRLTIPTGVSKVRLIANIEWVKSPTNQLVEIRKNGAPVLGGGAFIVSGTGGYSNQMSNISSAVLPVAAGDYFELTVYTGSSAETENLLRTWFSIEVVETTDTALPPFDHSFSKSGVPGSSEVLYQHVFPRSCLFDINLLSSQGFAGTVATAATVLDVQKNGGSVATIEFGAGSITATFTNAAEISFVAGDRLSVIAPAMPDTTLADILVTLHGNLIL